MKSNCFCGELSAGPDFNFTQVFQACSDMGACGIFRNAIIDPSILMFVIIASTQVKSPWWIHDTIAESVRNFLYLFQILHLGISIPWCKLELQVMHSAGTGLWWLCKFKPPEK